VHRDLKLENFLFEDDSPDSQLKLIDFGLSQYFKPKEMMHNSVGTPYYVAPEVLEGRYDAKCDIWSIGVITYMLLSGSPPFYGNNDADTLYAVKLGRWSFDEQVSKNVSENAKDFVTKCLTRRPNARPSAQEAMKHKWFKLLSLNVEEESKLPSLEIVEQIDHYIKRTSLSKIIMDVVAHTLLPTQIADLREQFTKFDVSQSGDITMADMRTILEQLDVFKEEDLQTIFSNVDIDQTGLISYHEFIAATVNRQHITEQNMQLAFERMSNYSLFITSADIVRLLGKTQYDVDQIMAEVGLQPDAKISFQDVSTAAPFHIP
jgi:calcium-dependent protein kinase